jgi:hypothetical protein
MKSRRNSPLVARACVAISPIPVPPPVMSATLSLTLNRFSSLKAWLFELTDILVEPENCRLMLLRRFVAVIAAAGRIVGVRIFSSAMQGEVGSRVLGQINLVSIVNNQCVVLIFSTYTSH